MPPEIESQSDGDGVVVPEEFQKQTHELLSKATTKHHLAHIRERVYDHEDKMRKEEMSKGEKKMKGAMKKGNTPTPENYSTEAMPG